MKYIVVHLKGLTLTVTEKMVSLDVESLFTNVSTEETIEIIINAVYNHPTLPPPPLKTDTMRKLLRVCTSETPFHFCGKTYVQIDGVSMESPFGPTRNMNLLAHNNIAINYYVQVNSLRLKSNITLKWACKHLWGCYLFRCWWYIHADAT